MLSCDVSRDSAGKVLLLVKFQKTIADSLWMTSPDRRLTQHAGAPLTPFKNLCVSLVTIVPFSKPSALTSPLNTH